MTTTERAQLFIEAWYETGLQHGYYLIDVPWVSIRKEHKEALAEEAREATRLKITPKRAQGMWTFIDVV